MAVVTISRQMGSLGSQIAFQAADMLGYRVVWRELINQAARRAGAPEAALAAIDELKLLRFCPTSEECLAYRQAVEQIMRELSEQGNVVIVGRAGQVILAGKPGTLHVRVTAPIELRARRVAEKTGIAFEYSLAQVKASDRFRAKYLRQFYEAKWDDPTLYDLTLNTARMEPGPAARIIAEAAVCLAG